MAFAQERVCLIRLGHVLFGLERSLEAAGFPKCGAWTRARKQIKTYLNRAHALQARFSDPDAPLGNKDNLDEKGGDGDGAQEEDDGALESHEVDVFNTILGVFRASADRIKGFLTFLEDNFEELSCLARHINMFSFPLFHNVRFSYAFRARRFPIEKC